MKNITSVFLLSFIASLFLGCTESAKNDGNSKASPDIPKVVILDDEAFTNFNEKLKLSPEVLTAPGESTGVGSAADEALRQDNLRKPIIYGVGAAGITMSTTFADSKTLLTAPFRGPFSNGVTFYNEQVIVVWKDEGDRKPAVIYVSKGYLGGMDAGKFGEINFQTKFLDYKGDDPQAGAARLTRELFVEFEKVEDPSFDCLAAGQCRLFYGEDTQPNMVLIFPGTVLLLAKEEFQISEVRIFRNADPGMLANNVDLATGDILIPGEEPFTLGQNHKDVFDRLNAGPIKSSPEIYVRTDYIGLSWSGFWYSFHRTNYVSTVSTPEETDISKTVSLSSEYSAYLTMRGQRILMKQSAEDLSFSLEGTPDPATEGLDTVVISAQEVESKMKMTTKILKSNSLKFAKKFSDFLKTELSQNYDTVNVFLFGYQDSEKANKEIQVSILAFNKSDLIGKAIAFEVNEEQETLNFIQVSLLDNTVNPFNQLILPMANTDVTKGESEQVIVNEVTGEPILDSNGQMQTEMRPAPYFTTLVGVELNDLIRLSEVDALGRGEATVELVSTTGQPAMKVRSGYVEQGQFDVATDNRPKARQQGYISVGFYGTQLGIKVIGSDDQGLLARVVSIGTANIHGKIQDVCGLGMDISFKTGMTDTEALKALNTAIADKQAVDANYKCDHFIIKDTGAVGRIVEIYFPGERMKLGFSDRALSSATIYLPFDKINQTLPEVN